jgi:hypothetical protein
MINRRCVTANDGAELNSGAAFSMTWMTTPHVTAGLRAFSLTCCVTQRDAEIVAWTF